MYVFTVKLVDNLKPKEKTYELSDRSTPGLVCRVEPSGNKYYYYRYSINGKRARIKLCSCRDTTLKSVREMTSEYRKLVDLKIDPKVFFEEKRRTKLNTPTFKEFAEEFKSLVISHRKRPEQAEYIIDNILIPAWGDLKLKEVKRRDVRQLLEPKKVISPVMVNRIQSLVHQIFLEALDREYISIVPTLGMKKIGGKETPRSRVLSDEELAKIWYGIDSCKQVNAQLKLAIKILLLSGQRSQEIRLAKQCEIDFRSNTWTIPEENSKNGRANTIPIDGLLGKHLRQLKLISHSAKFLVPSPVKKNAPIDERGICKAVAIVRNHLGMKHFTAHDLRRTVASKMSAIDIPHHIIDAILNHKETGINRHYIHHDYIEQKRNALMEWQQYLESIFSNEEENSIVA